MTENVQPELPPGQSTGPSGPDAQVRVAACTTPVRIADPEVNADTLLTTAHACDARLVSLVAFPELALTGYSIDDLFLQDVVLDAAEAALRRIVEASVHIQPVMVV